MHRTLTHPLVIGLLGLVTTAPTNVLAADPARRVEVHVTVTTNGAPFPEGTYVSMSGDAPDVPLDETGQAVLVGEYPADTETILVEIPTLIVWGPDEQVRAKNEAQKRANYAFSLPPAKLVNLVSGQEVYHVEFFAPEAITVKGRAVDATGKYRFVDAHRGGVFNPRLMPGSDGGFFEVHGVPKGQDSFLFLGTEQPEDMVVWLSAAETGVDLDLGNVVVPTAVTNAAIEIAVTGRDTVRSDLGMQRDNVTLVRDDGLAVYVLEITESGGVVHSPVGGYPEPPGVRAGRYYIVPGMSMASDSVLKALRLIRSGQQLLLDAAGVPVIEPVAGITTNGAINLAAVQQVIDGLPE